MTDSVITLKEVSKKFPSGFLKHKIAIENLNFTVPQGKIVGLIGPNGSGKSTTLKMILGFLKPTSGEIKVKGFDPSSIDAKKQIGYLPENPKFQKFLTARKALYYFSQLLGLPRSEANTKIEYLLSLVNLKEAANDRILGFSKGMVQRLAIAQAMLHNPAVIILDEPMSGLDPVGRVEVKKLISRIHNEFPQTTLFFSSHVLNDIEELCSEVIFLKKGNLVLQCDTGSLLVKKRQTFQVIAQIDDSAFLNRFPKHQFSPTGVSFSCDTIEELMQLSESLKKTGAEISAIHSHRRSLEEALFSENASLEIGAFP
jgi:ABC-2 type transport system ATP-binding protein